MGKTKSSTVTAIETAAATADATADAARTPVAPNAATAPNDAKNRESRLHVGHRQRMREQFLYDEIGDSSSAHELLELMLGYAIPRIDVNPLAHRLVDRFGNLTGVLRATSQELMSVPGMNEYTVCLLRLCNAMYRRQELEGLIKYPVYDTMDKLVTFLRPHFSGLNVERVYLMVLNNSLRLIKLSSVADGCVNCCAPSVRRIVENCLYAGANCAVLAHNHPQGLPIPSAADIALTQEIEATLNSINIPLLEHFVITEVDAAPILRPLRGLRRMAPTTKSIDEGFFSYFYGLPGAQKPRIPRQKAAN